MAEQTNIENQQRQLDTILNKTFIDLAAYSAIGFGAGLVASLFFKRGLPIRNMFAGVGASYGFVINKSNFNVIAWWWK